VTKIGRELSNGLAVAADGSQYEPKPEAAQYGEWVLWLALAKF